MRRSQSSKARCTALPLASQKKSFRRPSRARRILGRLFFIAISTFAIKAHANAIVGPQIPVAGGHLTAVVTELVQQSLFWVAVGNCALIAFNIWWSSRESNKAASAKEIHQLIDKMNVMIKDVEVIKATMAHKSDIRKEIYDTVELLLHRNLRKKP